MDSFIVESMSGKDIARRQAENFNRLAPKVLQEEPNRPLQASMEVPQPAVPNCCLQYEEEIYSGIGTTTERWQNGRVFRRDLHSLLGEALEGLVFQRLSTHLEFEEGSGS